MSDQLMLFLKIEHCPISTTPQFLLNQTPGRNPDMKLIVITIRRHVIKFNNFEKKIKQLTIYLIHQSGGYLNRANFSDFHHYIFIISQLWLTSHPRSTVVLLDTGTPGTEQRNLQ